MWKKYYISIGIGILLTLGLIIWANAKDEPIGGAIITSSSIDVNGKVINFTYTDDNKDETLIIKTSQSLYGGWEQILVPFSITNSSGADEIVDIQLYFNGNEVLSEIREFKENMPYQVTISDYGRVDYFCANNWQATTTFEMGEPSERYQCDKDTPRYCDSTDATTTCTVLKAFTGTHLETRYEDKWRELDLTSTIKADSLKILPVDYNVSNKATYSIKNNETKYFRADIAIPSKTEGRFWIEAKGINGAYGISG